MADYWISFRIKFDTTASYNRRYDALTKAIAECAEQNPTWETNTSFVAIRSQFGLEAIAGHLEAAIDETIDHVVVRIIGYTNTVYVGSPGANFATFFPAAKKV